MKEKISETDELLLACIQDRATDEEYQEAWAWIQADESNYTYYISFRDAWIAAGLADTDKKFNTSESWKKIKSRTIKKGSLFISPSFWRNAAVLFAAVFMGALGYYYINKAHINNMMHQEVCIEAPLGARSYVVLADSSKVWLNAGSKLRYAADYGITNRDLYLEGEAYFEVHHDKTKPFRVHAADLVIKALGTVFNVKAYPDEEVIQTTLVKGSVSLESADIDGRANHVVLEPKQIASYVKRDASINITKLMSKKAEIRPAPTKVKIYQEKKLAVESDVNPQIYTSWKDNRWIFQGENMEDLAIRLERMYDVKIIFKDPSLKNYHLSGTFEKETLDQVLDAIKMTIPLDYKIIHNTVELKIDPKLKEKYEKILKPQK